MCTDVVIFSLPGAENRICELAPRYDRRRTLAYAIARAAPSYAALQRVLKEVALAAEGSGSSSRFRPKMVLEYGARVGLSAWAVEEVGV